MSHKKQEHRLKIKISVHSDTFELTRDFSFEKSEFASQDLHSQIPLFHSEIDKLVLDVRLKLADESNQSSKALDRNASVCDACGMLFDGAGTVVLTENLSGIVMCDMCTAS